MSDLVKRLREGCPLESYDGYESFSWFNVITDEAADMIESLQARVAELEKGDYKTKYLLMCRQYSKDMERLADDDGENLLLPQLAASQAREKQLRDGLLWWAEREKLPLGLVELASSTTDDSALRGYVARELEACALQVNANGPYANNSNYLRNRAKELREGK